MRFDILAEGANGYDAIDLYFKPLPDLLATDITMSNCKGFHAKVKNMSRDPFAKALVCSVIGDASVIIESLKAGACGHVNKVNIFIWLFLFGHFK
ncbi:MAG: hypothetical protein MK132_20285 [Lentisphaerales bacterium]|nr:hypothetical protein [Lentisphaerales bacterium]